MFDRSSLLGGFGPVNPLLDTSEPLFNSSTTAPFKGIVVNNPAKLEALIAESHHWATAATIITSCINDMLAKNAADLSQMMPTLVPREAAFLEPLRTGLMEIELHHTLIGALLDSFALMSAGGDLIAAYAAEAKLVGNKTASVIHRDALTNHWRMICVDLHETLTDVMPEVKDRLPDIYFNNWQQLRLLLIETKNGGTPCIEDGTLYYPDLPQRRRSSRVGLLQRCEARCEGESFKAFAKDISQGGLGLEHCRPLPVGKTVDVELAHGRRLFGRVAWAHSNMVGVSLSTPLHPNDPLLFG